MGQRKETKKNLSITEKRELKAEQKRKGDINLRIKKAEKNIKHFFAHVKKILQKEDDELVISECGSGTVEQAKSHEIQKKYIRFLYAVSVAHNRQKQGTGQRDGRHIVYGDYHFMVNRNEFVDFMRFYMKDFTEI